jgi:hypothetical protein
MIKREVEPPSADRESDRQLRSGRRNTSEKATIPLESQGQSPPSSQFIPEPMNGQLFQCKSFPWQRKQKAGGDMRGDPKVPSLMLAWWFILAKAEKELANKSSQGEQVGLLGDETNIDQRDRETSEKESSKRTPHPSTDGGNRRKKRGISWVALCFGWYSYDGGRSIGSSWVPY